MIEKLPYYYRKSRVVEELYTAVQKILDKISADISYEDLSLFITTTTDFTLHEKDVGLSPIAADNETKRARVIARIQGNSVLTKSALYELIYIYDKTGCTITEDFPTKHLDIMGFNYCKTAWDDYHERMPHQPIIITEASSNSGTRGCYSTNENIGQYYILDPDNGVKCKNSQKAQKKDMGENEWKYFAERNYLAGIFLWTGMDYRGEPTPLGYPAVYSQFGIFDYCGFPKDNFYYYKSWWSDEPTIHIFPHWNFADKIGENINVYCYSNLDEVELFVNGKSYGKQKTEHNWYLTWENVVYEAGEVSAKGYKNGKEVMTKTVKTTDAPYKIELMPYKDNIAVGETAIVNVRIADKNGMTVPTADNEIFFNVEGTGRFLGTGNGNSGSHESDKIPVRRAFNGLCQLLVKAADMGIIKITAQSNELIQGICVVEVNEQ